MLAMTIENFVTSDPKITAALSACERGEFAQSAALGTQCLLAQDQYSRQDAAIDRDIVSFSLFGEDPVYCETAILNARRMNTFFPGWEMRVYHDSSVPVDVIHRLQEAGAQTVDAKTVGIAHWPGTFWRFYAVHEPRARRVLFRDADSDFSERECELVTLWQSSEQAFHVIRDWYTHIELMLAGLWGGHAPLLGGMQTWIETYLINTQRLHPTHADQFFLAQHVWPRIADFCLVHDTIHDLGGVMPTISKRPGTHSSDALGGFKCTQMNLSMNEHTHRYAVIIHDEQNQLVCRYERTPVSGKDEFYLPTTYINNIKHAGWTIEYKEVFDPTHYTVTVTPKSAATA